MNQFIIYSLEAALSLALFYTAYHLFLKKETFFVLNRFYLLLTALMAVILPLLNLSSKEKEREKSYITQYLTLPITEYKQDLLNTLNQSTTQALPPKMQSISRQQSLANRGNNGYTLHAAELTPFDKQVTTSYPWWLNTLFYIYFIGLIFFFVRFILNLVWFYIRIKKQAYLYKSGTRYIRINEAISPFSFLHFICIGNHNYSEDDLHKIMTHEKIHVQQNHSYDLLFFELLFIVQWFNPFVWAYKQALKLTHEYLADLGAIKSGIELHDYQYSMLNQSLHDNQFKMANQFHVSTKNRIKMMLQKRSSTMAALKVLVVLPILVFVFSAFAYQPLNKAYAQLDKTQESTKEANLKDSLFKTFPLSPAYLKLIEGEYISTNEVNRIRRIIFTELDGTMYGYDNGYSYKIMPVGEGKFINPDDKATLEFNTQNKEAVSLLLFGKINLLKQSGNTSTKLNRSMAFALVKIMLRDGYDAALRFFESVKDSSHYYLVETELNLAGYQFLQANKAMEAANIFKLNTLFFPQSFNVYDSYGEALLKLGKKDLAISNYIQSVKLNPGNKSGLKALKELGVVTDTLIKKVNLSSAYLNLLEGDYLSTDQANWIRRITFSSQKGRLVGNDNGYRYELIALGDEKFINPDDGASLVFNTKDKNNISLLLFGSIHLRKINPIKEPQRNISNYAGLYVPDKKDSILKTMVLICEKNQLYRFIENDPQPSNRKIALERVEDHLFFYTDKSARSIEFILNDKNEVIDCLLRRYDGTYKLHKQK